ncbi:hypothetical protein CDD83_10407 [Cordyceps sp. RAO-2017]|nr:hypothetical protein CDD83_10407 [Cordyceps sp. RAO-2017]
MTSVLLLRWHRLLRLQQQTLPWYRQRLREELSERRLAASAWQRLSETADVFYTISRAHHDGHLLRGLPKFSLGHIPVLAYLVPKYTLRWAFYRVAACCCRAPDPASVREVVNPAKDRKLCDVAARHGIDPTAFVRVCRRLRLVWPLLP